MTAIAELPSRHPALPFLDRPQPLRIALFFANAGVLERFSANALMPQMLRATEATFARYNLTLDRQPAGLDQLEGRVLGVDAPVRAPRKLTPPGRLATDEEAEQLATYVQDALALARAADARMPGEQTTRFKFIFCAYDSDDAELARAERKSKQVFITAETLPPDGMAPGTPPFALFNLHLPRFALGDPGLIFVMSHEIVHGAGIAHNQRRLRKNLMNAVVGDGDWLTQPQLDAVAAAPFCRPLAAGAR